MFAAAVQSLDGARPNTNPKTSPNPNTKLIVILILTLTLTLFANPKCNDTRATMSRDKLRNLCRET